MSAGAVVWLTGPPAAGKSTLARRLVARLAVEGLAHALLDGDAVRAALGRPAGRGATERDAFYEALARLAALLARQGLVVVVAATAHRRAHRRRARALAPRFLEVYVATPAAARRARDPRGLYAAAARGEAAGVPGADLAYEPPRAPEVVAADGRDPAAVERVLGRLAARRRRPVPPRPARRAVRGSAVRG